MEKNIFKALQRDLMERLGECYCQDEGYKRSIRREAELSKRMKGSLSEEQAALAEEYHSAVSATMCICELLAYRQGMRDMADILYGR